MQVQVLGCSGGIGDGRHTTSFLIDDDILLDAGSGVSRLSRAALARIDHVFITHSHLDHILSLPLLLDSVAATLPLVEPSPMSFRIGLGFDAESRCLNGVISGFRIWNRALTEIKPEVTAEQTFEALANNTSVRWPTARSKSTCMPACLSAACS